MPMARAHHMGAAVQCSTCGGDDAPKTASPAQAAFEKLKALAGVWKAVGSDYKITFEVASAGSIVIEREGDMVSVYHLDGDTLMMTHYCDLGNQPRLRATNFTSSNALTFDFVDITNLKVGQGHIDGLTTQWLDNGNIKEIWTSKNADGSPDSITFELARDGGK
jgi:hypothetical protein